MRWSLEEFVYGATDGAVTTFAVVAGVVGEDHEGCGAVEPGGILAGGHQWLSQQPRKAAGQQGEKVRIGRSIHGARA